MLVNTKQNKQKLILASETPILASITQLLGSGTQILPSKTQILAFEVRKLKILAFTAQKLPH